MRLVVVLSTEIDISTEPNLDAFLWRGPPHHPVAG